MKKTSHAILSIGILAVFFGTFAGSCDHTVLQGEIHSPDAELRVGEQVLLELHVPEEQKGIHNEYWLVTPQDAGSFLPEGGSGRCALFMALKPGTCTVKVRGFFRQTNPQPITSMELTIRP